MENEICPWEAEVDTDDEEWFFSSMKSYKHLLIYSVSAVPELLEVSECGRRLAVAVRATQATSELVYYLLPSKILARSAEEEGLSNSRDFKITAGAVTSEPVSGLRFLPGGTGLLTISQGQPGVQLWSVQPDEDQLQREAPKCPGAGANSRLIPSAFCVSSNHAFLTDGNAVERISLSTAEVTNTWPLDILPSSAGRSVEAIHAAEDESSLHLAFSSGVYCRLDLTAEGAVTSVQTSNLSNDEAGITSSWHWQFAKSQDKEKSGGLFLFGVSSQGVLRVFDIATMASPVLECKLEFDSRFPLTQPALAVSLVHSQLLVTCGDCVHIYNFNIGEGRISLDFKHEGHKRKKQRVRVLAAQFHPQVPKLIFTTDSEKNIHAWQYEL